LESDPAQDDVAALFAVSKMLEPTDIEINLRQRSKLRLDQCMQIDINFEPLVFSLDYKDIAIFYKAMRKY